jgi:ACT domain-containing protein
MASALPNNRRCYATSSVQAALHDVLVGKIMTMDAAVKEYNLPRSTLFKYQKLVRASCKGNAADGNAFEINMRLMSNGFYNTMLTLVYI